MKLMIYGAIFLQNQYYFFNSLKYYLQKSLYHNEKIMNRNCTWSCLSVVLCEDLSGSTVHGTIGRVFSDSRNTTVVTLGGNVVINANFDEMKHSIRLFHIL